MDYKRYRSDAYGYWDRSRRGLNEFELARHKLFYVAYELRCAIEAFLYDYLSFIHDGELTKKLNKLYSAKNLRAAILRIEPYFEKRIQFDNLIHESMGFSVVNIPVPDLNRLGKIYGKLGSYMHIQKELMDDDDLKKWVDLESLVKEAQGYLHDIVHPQKARVKLTDEGIELFTKYAQNQLDDAEVRRSLSIGLKEYVKGTTLLFGSY